MKNFKKVLSLALAVMMVIGGLVIAPVDAKADETYNRVWDKRDVADGGEFVIVYAKDDGTYYAVGNTFASNSRPKQVEVTVSNGVVSLSAGSEETALPTWTFTKTSTEVGSAEVARINLSYSNAGTTTYLNWNTGTKFAVSTEATGNDEWIIKENTETDCFSIMETESSRYLAFYSSGTDFRPYGLGSGADGCNEYMLFKAGTVISEANDVDAVLTPEYDTYAEIVDAAYALAEGASLSDPGDGNATFTLQGKVISYDGTLTYSPYAPIYTIVVEGKEDKPIQCYGLKAGEATGIEPADVQVGDTITVKGAIKNYYGTVEFNGCTLDAYTAGPGVGTYADQQAVVDAVLALNSGWGLAGTHTLSGVVSKVEDNTVYFTIGDTTVTVSKPYDAENTAIDLTTIAAGDTVSVTGTVKNNDGTVEFLKNSTTTVTKAPTSGGTEDEDDTTTESETDSETESEKESTTTLSAAEIMALAEALAEGEALEGTYKLQGVITEIGEYNTEYKDVSLTIKVNGTEKTIYCYAVKGEGNDTLKVGDEIAVSGTIKNYKGTIEFDKPELVPIDKKGDMAMPVALILFAGCALVAVAVVSKKRMA